MQAKRDVLVIGSHVYGVYVGCKALPHPGETIEGRDFQPLVLDDGGKGSNQAMCAARLGASTTFIGAVGADREGRLGLKRLAQQGVDVSGVIEIEGQPTGVSVAIVDQAGSSMIVTVPGANAALSLSHLDSVNALFASHRFCLLQFETDSQVAIEAARRARAHGSRAILTPGPMPTLAQDALRGVDILAPNETEAAQLLDHTPIGSDPAHAARRIHERWGVSNVILTLGARGCAAFWDGELIEVPSFAIDAKNTIGAGDAFAAALATGLCRALPIREALMLASSVAALTVSHPGAPWASYPQARDVARFLAQRGHAELAQRAGML